MRNKGVRQFVMRVDDELYEFLKKVPLEEVMTEEPLFLPEEPRGKKKRRVYVSLKKEDFKELELLAKRYAVSRSKLLRAKLRALRLKQVINPEQQKPELEKKTKQINQTVVPRTGDPAGVEKPEQQKKQRRTKRRKT